MKINLLKLLGILAMFWSSLLFAQGPMIPFDTTTADLFLTQYGTKSTGPDQTTEYGTSFYKFDISNVTFDYTQVGVTKSIYIKLNAMGYNPVDNFIYAINVSVEGNNTTNPTRGHLYRIGQNFQIQDMGLVTNLPRTREFGTGDPVVDEYIAGDFDSVGNYYVKASILALPGNPRDRIYKIKLYDNNALFDPTASLITANVDFTTADFTYNKDGFFYGVDDYPAKSNRKRFYKFKITGNTAAVTFFSEYVGVDGQSFGAMFSDGSTGTVYGNRNDGGFYRFNKVNGVQTKVSPSIGSKGNDGANNPLGRIQFNVDLQITKDDGKTTYIPGTTNVYTINVTNNGPSTALDARVQDALPTNVPAANFSWTKLNPISNDGNGITSAPVTGPIDDEVDILLNQTVTYTVTVLVPSNYTGPLSNTATVTASPDNKETILDNNSDTDTDTLAPCTINIGTQPASQTVCLNGTVELSVAATGNGTVLYQWYRNTTNSNTGGTSIFGATSATYTPPTTAVGTIYYYAVASIQGYAVCNEISNVATVEVTPEVTIDTQPTSLIVCANAPALLSVTASGSTTLTYQWFSNTTASNIGGSSISGETSSTYSSPTATAGTFYYYVVVSGGGACGIVTSAISSVTVNAAPVITVQPAATQTVCLGAATTALIVTATTTGTGTLTYQWFSNATNSSTGGTLIGGATSATYTPASTPVGTSYYYVVVTDSAGISPCDATTSTVSTVIVSPLTAITAQPLATQTVCQGATATAISVTATGSGILTYQWYSNTANNSTTGTVIGGATTATYTPVTTSTGTLYYYVIVTGTCGSVTSAISSVTVNAAPVITVQPATPLSYCVTDTATPLSVTATSTGGALSYQWYSNTSNSTTGSSAVGTNSSSYTPVITVVGTMYYYVVVTDAGGTAPCDTATSTISKVEVTACVCYDDPNTTDPAVPTNHGITVLNRAGANNGNWPMIRSSAFTVLESNTKGFVITRVATADLGLITAPQEGMMVYDTTEKCLKLYDGTAWSCFSTPACP